MTQAGSHFPYFVCGVGGSGWGCTRAQPYRLWFQGNQWTLWTEVGREGSGGRGLDINERLVSAPRYFPVVGANLSQSGWPSYPLRIASAHIPELAGGGGNQCSINYGIHFFNPSGYASVSGLLSIYVWWDIITALASLLTLNNKCFSS